MSAIQDSESTTASILSRKIGLTMAICSTFFGVLYILGLVVNLITSSSFYPSGEDVRIVSSMVALLWNLVLLILFVTLRREASLSRSVLGELALVFGVLVCMSSSVSWFVGLTSYHRLTLTTNAAVANLFNPYDPASLAYALEHLGWGLFFGLATLFAGLSLDPRKASGWLRWSLVATSVLSLAHFLGVLINNSTLTLLGFLSWGVIFPFASAMTVGMFREALKRLPS